MNIGHLRWLDAERQKLSQTPQPAQRGYYCHFLPEMTGSQV
jgi:hypothetical protein